MNVLLLILLFPRTMKRLFIITVMLSLAAVVWGMAASEGGRVNCLETPSAASCQAMGVR